MRCKAAVLVLCLTAGRAAAEGAPGAVEAQLGVGMSVIRSETWAGDQMLSTGAAQLDGLVRVEATSYLDIVASGTLAVTFPPECEDEQDTCGRVQRLSRLAGGAAVKTGSTWRWSAAGLVGWQQVTWEPIRTFDDGGPRLIEVYANTLAAGGLIAVERRIDERVSIGLRAGIWWTLLRLGPNEDRDLLGGGGLDPAAWQERVDALSVEVPITMTYAF